MTTPGPGSADRRLWVDVGLACLVPTVQLALLVATGVLRPWSPADALTIVLVLAQGVPLAARRSRPWVVFLLVLVANSAYYALGLPPTGYDLGLAIALYSVAEQRSARASILAYGIVVAVILVMKVLTVGPYWAVAPWFLVSYLWVFFGAAWAWGRYQHVRAERLRDLVTMGERERQDAAKAAVREERIRIARELHDVIAHHLSMMVIQAGGARRLVEQDPSRAREALHVIEEYGRRGLEAMPGLLKALRSDPTSTDLAPAPRLADLDSMIDQLGRSGQDVTLEVEGAPRPLPEDVELSAYRIVQEALTNALRHAPGARVTIQVCYQPGDLVVVVSDDGPGLGARRDGGHGLAGMRERALLLGGSWEIDGAPSGGCRVRTRLPCPVRSVS